MTTRHEEAERLSEELIAMARHLDRLRAAARESSITYGEITALTRHIYKNAHHLEAVVARREATA